MKCLRTDGGGEYFSKSFASWLSNEGIEHPEAPPHSPQLNGAAERWNRTLGERIRCLLISFSLPQVFWADAMRYLLGTFPFIPCKAPDGFRSPHASLGLPPLSLDQHHPFGCTVWYKVPEPNCLKLDAKGKKGALLSYLPSGNGYTGLDLALKKTVRSRDVHFLDSEFPFLANAPPLSKPPVTVDLPILAPHPSAPALPTVPSVLRPSLALGPAVDSLSPSPSCPPLPAPASDMPNVATPAPALPPSPTPAPPLLSQHRSGRSWRPPDRFGFPPSASNAIVQDPKTWSQVQRSPDRKAYLQAANTEFSALLGQNTWDLVLRPVKRKIIKARWVFWLKRRVDGTLLKRKARLVAMGFTQVAGLDYEEVFSPTMCLEMLRLILSLMASRRWVGRQIDFKAAFLNSDL